MNLKDQPFRRMVQMMKSAAEVAKDRQSERDKADQCSNVTEMIQETVFDYLAPEEQKKLKFATPDLEYKPLYEKINHMMHRDLGRLSRGSKTMENLIELCELLKIAIGRNAKKLFNNPEKRAAAIEQIDQELQRVLKQVDRLKQSKSKRSAQLQTEGGTPNVNVTKTITELYELCDILNQAGAAVPEFIEEYIWEEEYENWIVVRKRERFVLKGDERVVLYALLETPVTRNVRLIRFGSDYWLGAETAVEVDDDAFFVRDYPDITGAVAEIIDTLNQESDLELGLIGETDSSFYDTFSSLNHKLSQLLA